MKPSKKIAKIMKEIQFKNPYEAGLDAGKNGADIVNTNFRWFNTRENTKQWESGNKAGKTGICPMGEKIEDCPFTPPNNL